MDESTHKLQESIQQWSVDEAQVVDKILHTLDGALEEIEAISTKTKVADVKTQEVLDLVLQRVSGEERAELVAALEGHHSDHVELITFLNRLKYNTFLTIEHDINLQHSKADTKRAQFKAHIDAVNDVSEIMSGNLLGMATKESHARQNAVEVRVAIKNLTRRFVSVVLLLNLIILLLVYYRIIPPFIIVYIAHTAIETVGEVV